MTEHRLWAPRRRLGGALSVGILLGAGALLVLVAAGDSVARASSTSFALGALVLGFGLTIWATTVWMGDVFETFLETTVGDSEWSKSSGAVAFSLITMAGAGMMLGSVATTLGLRALGL